MKYSISLIVLTAFLSFLFPVIAFGASYPASCPVEARAIVDAVGGCSTIDPGQYSSIYEKCCSVIATPARTITPAPRPSAKPTIEPGLTSEPTPEPSPESDSEETVSDSLAILVLILFLGVLGGLIYLVIWFIRKRKKKKGSVPAMPEKKCPYCKSVVPGDSKFCSHCQADLRNWLRRHPIWTAIIALVLLVLIIGLVSS